MIRIIRKRCHSHRNKGINWSEACCRYISENLQAGRSKRYSLIDLAGELGVSVDMVRVKSSEGQWTQKLKQAREEAQEATIQQAKKTFVIDQREMLKRLVGCAQVFQAKAMKAAEHTPIDKLSAKDQVAWFSMAAQLEMKLCGIPDMAVVRSAGGDDSDPLSPAARVAEAQRLRALALRFEGYLQKKYGTQWVAQWGSGDGDAVEGNVVRPI